MTGVPRVTIGVPVYNGEKFLPAALDSVLGQDFEDMEIIISDNASTDATADIGRAAAEADARVRYHRNPANLGGGRNLNKLLAMARGSLFKWAYYDDICQPSLIRRSVEVLDEAGPSAVLAYSRVEIIDADGAVVDAYGDHDLGLDAAQPDVRLRSMFANVVSQTQFGLIRTDVLRTVGGASEQMGGEFVMPAALCLRGRNVAVSQPLLQLRRHPGQHGGTRRTELRWIDPTGRKTILFPYSRASVLLLAAIREAPLTAIQRRKCLAVLVRYFTIPQWRYLASDLRHLPEDLTHDWK